MKKILVTGSLGYIGSVLMPYLKNRGYNCIGYDTGYFKDCLLYEHDDGRVIAGDMRHFDLQLLDGVCAVVHLAGISNDPFGDLMPEAVFNFGREYALRLAQACKERKIKFVFASSCSIYGKGPDSLIDEDSEVFPQTPYSVNKLEIENDLAGITDSAFCPVCLRFSTLFGLSPRMRFDIVVNMLTAMAFTTKKVLLNSDGQAWRPYIHIIDVCKAIQHSVEYNDGDDSPLLLNVGDSSQNFQIIRVAEMVKDAIPGCSIQYLNKKGRLDEEDELIRDRKVQDGVDTRTYKVSFERIKQVFNGFECEYNVEEGIRIMIEKFKEINLTPEQFKSIQFYRLQKMEDLHKHHYISDDLFWLR